MKIGAPFVSIALLAVSSVAFAQANEFPPLKRGFDNGRFVDEYFGIAYTTKGLQASIPTGFLFAGRLESGAVVEVGIRESDEGMNREQWLADTKKGWVGGDRKRAGIEEGVGTYAWIRFDQPEADGTVIHHGYALYPRGHQCFVVHAMIPRSQASSVEIVETALGGLRLSDRPDTFRLAHLIAEAGNRDPRDPQIISQAAAQYMESGNQALAFLAATRAEQIAQRQEQAGLLDPKTAWQLALDGGAIFAAAGNHELAITYLRRCSAFAESLANEPAAAAACRYQLSRSMAQLGRINDAFRALASALYGTEDSDTIDFIIQQARTEPDLEPLRADGRWNRLLR